jgi:ankyrin repeat protein
VNSKDEKNNTPLHYATSRGLQHIVRTLIAHGADMDAKNIEGITQKKKKNSLFLKLFYLGRTPYVVSHASMQYFWKEYLLPS